MWTIERGQIWCDTVDSTDGDDSLRHGYSYSKDLDTALGRRFRLVATDAKLGHVRSTYYPVLFLGPWQEYNQTKDTDKIQNARNTVEAKIYQGTETPKKIKGVWSWINDTDKGNREIYIVDRNHLFDLELNTTRQVEYIPTHTCQKMASGVVRRTKI